MFTMSDRAIAEITELSRTRYRISYDRDKKELMPDAISWRNELKDDFGSYPIFDSWDECQKTIDEFLRLSKIILKAME